MAAMVIEGAKQIAQHGRSIVYRRKDISFSHTIFKRCMQLYMRSNPQINERFPTSEIRIYVTEAED